MSKYSDDINDQRIAAAIRGAGHSLSATRIPFAGTVGDMAAEKLIDWYFEGDKKKRPGT